MKIEEFLEWINENAVPGSDVVLIHTGDELEVNGTFEEFIDDSYNIETRDTEYGVVLTPIDEREETFAALNVPTFFKREQYKFFVLFKSKFWIVLRMRLPELEDEDYSFSSKPF